MRDAEVVASIVAGDPEGLATAYDRYADPLYTYCRSVLRDPADAADAVQDTFVIAASRLDGLRDPDKLRSWLYAVARNECMRILRASKDTSALDEAPDVIDESVDVGADAERAELRTLFQEASAGLNPSERDVINLSLQHKMEAGEIADVLGVSKNHAHSLLSRARAQLEACLGALLVGRSGREECSELGSLLGNWDGTLTVLLRKRLHRHIEHCSTCTELKAFALRPAAFFGLPPLVAIAGALRWLSMPTAFKAKVLALATGTGSATAAQRAAIVHHAGSFHHSSGFPHAAHAAKAGAGALHGAGAKAGSFLKTPQGQGTAAAVIIAIIAASTAFALTGNDTPSHSLANSRPGQSQGGGSGGGSGGGGSKSGGGSGGSKSGGPKSSGPKSGNPKSGGSGAPGSVGPGIGSGLPTGTSPTSPGTGTTIPGTGTTTPGAPGTPGTSQYSLLPTSLPTGTQQPSTVNGFSASPNDILLPVGSGGTPITLSNSSGGPVHWSMSVSQGAGTVKVSPAAGTLPSGQKTTVEVTATSTAQGATITLTPNDTTWIVTSESSGASTSGPAILPSGTGLPGSAILPSSVGLPSGAILPTSVGLPSGAILPSGTGLPVKLPSVPTLPGLSGLPVMPSADEPVS